MRLANRRYTGAKTKLLGQIDAVIAAIIRDIAKEGYRFDNAFDGVTGTYKYGIKMWREMPKRNNT